jgi:hypothetical protein
VNEPRLKGSFSPGSYYEPRLKGGTASACAHPLYSRLVIPTMTKGSRPFFVVVFDLSMHSNCCLTRICTHTYLHLYICIPVYIYTIYTIRLHINPIYCWHMLSMNFIPHIYWKKGLKYNWITLLGFILTISTSFGESMNLQGLFRKYANKPL